jgi:hypothetical protein
MAKQMEVNLMTEKEPIRKYKTVDGTFQILCYKAHEQCGKDCPQMKLWREVATFQKLGFKCFIRNGSDIWETKFAYDPLGMMFS